MNVVNGYKHRCAADHLDCHSLCFHVFIVFDIIGLPEALEFGYGASLPVIN